MREKISLDAILDDLEVVGAEGGPDWTDRRAVTVWLRTREKERFDKLQKRTRRDFGRKLRELILAAMDVAEAKAG